MVALVLVQRVPQVQALQELVWVLCGVLRLVEEHRVWVHQAVVDFRVVEQWVAQFQADQALLLQVTSQTLEVLQLPPMRRQVAQRQLPPARGGGPRPLSDQAHHPADVLLASHPRRADRRRGALRRGSP